LVECKNEITQDKLDLIREKGLTQIEVLLSDESSVGPYLRNTLLQDRIVRPKTPSWNLPRLEARRSTDGGIGDQLFQQPVFSIRIATTCQVGRLKLNHRLQAQHPAGAGTSAKKTSSKWCAI